MQNKWCYRRKLFWIVRRRKTLTRSLYICIAYACIFFLSGIFCYFSISVSIHFLSWFFFFHSNEQWSLSWFENIFREVVDVSLRECMRYGFQTGRHIVVFNYLPALPHTAKILFQEDIKLVDVFIEWWNGIDKTQ